MNRDGSNWLFYKRTIPKDASTGTPERIEKSAERSKRDYRQGSGRAHMKVEWDPIHLCGLVTKNK